MVSLRPQMPGATIGPPPGPKEISAQTARKAAATLEAARRGARRAGQEAQDAVPCWPLDPRADGGEEGPPSGPKQNLTPNPVSASTGLREGSAAARRRPSWPRRTGRRGRRGKKYRQPSVPPSWWRSSALARTTAYSAQTVCLTSETSRGGRHEHIRSNNLHAANRTRRDPNVARCDRREI